MKPGTWQLLFWVDALLEVVAVAMGWNSVQLWTKPLLMILLIAFYYSKAEQPLLRFPLFFCWAGDVFLLFQSSQPNFFIFGLISFLMGHLLYIISYMRFRWRSKEKELLWTQKVRFSLPIMLAGIALVVMLYPNLASLKLPVIIYAMVLVGMVMAAIFRYGRTSPESFRMVFAGAGLFMVSDSILAINKFHHAIPLAGVWIMVTYIAAQYLIVSGILKHTKQTEQQTTSS